jgi:hypothetical protein
MKIEIEGFGLPVRVEVPLKPLEAFRLASFGIEYVPEYVALRWDKYCAGNALYRINDDCILIYKDALAD